MTEVTTKQKIMVRDGGGVGANSVNNLFVDGKFWGFVGYRGRHSGWAIYDSQRVHIGAGKTKLEATETAIKRIEEGQFPPPIKAWQDSVQRTVEHGLANSKAKHLDSLFAATIDFIIFARSIPAVAEMNSFQRLVGEVTAIFDGAADPLKDGVAVHAQRIAKPIIDSPTFMAETQRNLDEFQKRLEYARGIIARIKPI